jgi:hypothetical protein
MDRADKLLYQTEELDHRTIDDALRKTSLYNKLQRNQGLIDDIGMNMLAWTMSQLQGEVEGGGFPNATHLDAYDRGRLLH